MVFIKRVELSHFKSFGGITSVPLLPGFTVISGPNGSGKSNILDALLFCLGLASSRGMRADRLPDLVNNKQNNQNRTVETTVSVTFDLTDLTNWQINQDLVTNSLDNKGENNSQEWKVTRRLRVTKGGSYSSTFYINDQVATAAQLQEQLNRLRIYPEGYNVVLQGDVTRIITMNGRERREIIDELAGVAAFDRKIAKTKATLAEVKEREERCRIIEQELISNQTRLAADRAKAEKYQQLRATLSLKKQQELIVVWHSWQQQLNFLQQEIESSIKQSESLSTRVEVLAEEITKTGTEVERLNIQVKLLGEDEQLSVASRLATQKAKHQSLSQQLVELQATWQQSVREIKATETEIIAHHQNITGLREKQEKLQVITLPGLKQECDTASYQLTEMKSQADAIAIKSEAWIQEQTHLSQEISGIQKILNPQKTQQAQLNERKIQLEKQIDQQKLSLAQISPELVEKRELVTTVRREIKELTEQIQSLASELAAMEEEVSIAQETQNRLLREQREKQRELDKLEATQQAQQEIQGTYSTKLLLNSDLPGVHGLVVNLGQVAPPYQLALTIAAGGRLGYLVVEDDSVAAAGISLLKQEKAGRATFLPLNKIKPSRNLNLSNLRQAKGYINLAANLVTCESRYWSIFSYVFGNTIVFESLEDARAYLGQYRIVTLAGDLLETSGAMTGGSFSRRSGLSFGDSTTGGESQKLRSLRQRLSDIDRLVANNSIKISDQSQAVKQLSIQLTEKKQILQREKSLILQQLEKEIERLNNEQQDLMVKSENNQNELLKVQQTLEKLMKIIPEQEEKLAKLQQKLVELETSHVNSQWQQIQNKIKTNETDLKLKEEKFQAAQKQQQELKEQINRITEKIAQQEKLITKEREKQRKNQAQQQQINKDLSQLSETITETEIKLKELSAKLGETKQQRDAKENKLKKLQQEQQKTAWELEKIQTLLKEQEIKKESLAKAIKQKYEELPQPQPDISDLISPENQAQPNYTEILETLQKQISRWQKRLEAMEPVNMLALEEYEKNQTRLAELSEKLGTLEAERTELLLRVEKFTTLRLRAFQAAFDAVNENFKSIFADLSDGDGYLELDNSEDPFAGGLNLVAHPKGKPVQKLSSMSGGEKSLTALSFIFSLQKYRPSPFYAFDEVDMFLDEANVERLAKIIKQQMQEAQFLVVSHKAPMLKSAQHIIGVTQARGAHTQVLGIQL